MTSGHHHPCDDSEEDGHANGDGPERIGHVGGLRLRLRILVRGVLRLRKHCATVEGARRPDKR
jgi:hypothetical protein